MTDKESKEKICIIPGSFDPMTVGHRELAERALLLFDRVIIAVMNNPEKKYLFSRKARVEIAKLTCSGLENVTVEASDGLTAELYEKTGASALVKGVRNQKDFSYELFQSDYNYQRPEKCETVFLPSRPGSKRISSTAVRKKLEKGTVPSGLLAPAAAAYISERLGMEIGR
ncbi:MAG: pantetheine-phosphate adenylyltransferase [Clostridia bacterium]|nr:pantetheine-phosphate adenylyltransferase [Clostridia bacterium]